MKLSTIHLVVSNYYDIDKMFIFKDTREKEVVSKRQIFHYVSRKLTEETLESIGKYYSDVSKKVYDHATVVNSIKKVEGYMLGDATLRNEVNQIINTSLSIKISFEIDLNTIKMEFIKSISNANSVDELSRNIKIRQNELSEQRV